MFRNKKIKMMNFEDFENLKKDLNNYSIFFVCFDKNGKPLAYRTIIIIGDNAWDLAAATSFDGRKLFAGFGILVQVLDYLRSKNICKYDLGAINKKTIGINSFKIGTGAHPTHYVGEYEYSGFKILNFITNNFVRLTFSKLLQYFFFFRSLYF
jgi:lipid II:glycine glycyltransferase (peptidoglycan interpeptide bridge formation enzyme)